MIKLPTYHHPYRGTVPFHQSVHPLLRGGASRRGKPLSGSTPLERQPTPVTARSAPARLGRPLSGIAHFVPAPTPVSSSVFSQQRAEKMYRERLWLLHFHQSLLDTRSSRRALEVTKDEQTDKQINRSTTQQKIIIPRASDCQPQTPDF